jgi:serine/threonine-protein kinase
VLFRSAVHKDPASRCPSAERLAADVERHLAGRPIEARGDSLGYRLGKLLRRHRLAAAMTAVAALALVLGLYLALDGLVRARRAEAMAQREAATSARVSDLLVGIFEVNDPSESRGGSVTARELLDRGAERVRTELAGQPEVQSRLFRTVGEAYSKLGLFRRAAEQFERDLALRERRPAEARQLASSLARLSAEESRGGDYRKALRLGRRALAVLEGEGDPEGPEAVRAWAVTGTARSHLGELAEAGRSLRQAVSLAERIYPADAPELAELLSDLAVIHWRGNDLDAAGALYRRALSIFEKRNGPRHLTVANVLNNLALVEQKAGRHTEARALHGRALAIRRAVLAPDHPDISESLNNLGTTLLSLGETEAAGKLLEEALAVRERVLGPEHPFLAATLCNLGIARARLGDPRAARPLLERSIALQERVLGPDHPEIAYPLQILAMVYKNTGNLRRADAASLRLVALRERHRATEPAAYLGQTYLARAKVLRALGRAREAAAFEERAAPLLGS